MSTFKVNQLCHYNAGNICRNVVVVKVSKNKITCAQIDFPNEADKTVWEQSTAHQTFKLEDGAFYKVNSLGIKLCPGLNSDK